MPKIIRSPIVVVMGHIDHGKSTLLDYIRQSNVVASEAGGITQATSAYEASHEAGGKKHLITFLDTPGHAAFAGMRERGATIADIAILVISAEEGVKAQTLEAQADIITANLPYIVAINKIDRPNANPELIKQQLAENNILLEGYGGTVPVAEISAKTGQGVTDLLDLLLLLAELQNLEAEPATPASGYVLESHLDPRAGIAATLIIKNGTLHTGDFIVTAGEISKIKNLRNFAAETKSELPPAAPARVIGLAALPPIGASFQTFTNKKEAEKFAENEKGGLKNEVKNKTSTLPETVVEIPLVLKADVAGSLEALTREVKKLENEQVRLKIVGASVGRISDSDIKLGADLILGFNTNAEKNAGELAEKLGVEIITFNIIYKLSEWLEERIKAKTPKREEVVTIGKAKLLKIFSQEKDKQVVGGVVTEGRFLLGKAVKIWRRDNEVARGKVLELQEQKLPAKEIEADHQFGALVECRLPLAVGDMLEVVDIVER